MGKIKRRMFARIHEYAMEGDVFLTNTNFPNCLGAVDGKHIRIIRPPNSGLVFYNYKHYYSVVLLVMCNADYEFTYINVGVQGKESDSAIFSESRLYQ